MFTLSEELLLLSVHEVKGTFIGTALERLNSGLAGAILAELALAGKIQTSKNHRLQLIDDAQMEDDVLNEALDALKEAEKERKFGYWVCAFSQRVEKIRLQTIENLAKKGAVTQDDDRLIWVTPSPMQEGIKASTKHLLINRWRGIVLTQNEDAQLQDIVLLVLVRACGLLDLIFLRDERKFADRYIYELMIKQALKNPALQTIQEIETVVTNMVEED